MNQTTAEPAADPAKKRREYLSKKITATALLGVTAIVCAYACVYVLIGIIPAILHIGIIPLVFWLVIAIAAAVAAGSALLFRSTGRTIRSLPYVPRVDQQIAALPGKEVLLRGSDQPAAAPKELVRPSYKTETPAEELLRAFERNP
jgi:hypothetical protein